MNTKYLIIFFIFILTSSCYVPSMTTITNKDAPIKGKIMLVSKIDTSNFEYIKDMCGILENKLSDEGYEVTEYVKDNYDSLHFSKVLETVNPNNVLLIFPSNSYKIFSTGFVEQSYSVELINRQNSINTIIYNGVVKITYRNDKKDIVISKSANKIFNVVFKSN